MTEIKSYANFIWSIADLLRGDYKQADYGKIILPLTVLRRLDCVLEPTKDEVLEKAKELTAMEIENHKPFLCDVTGHTFYNTSLYTFKKLLDEPNGIAANLQNYITGFSKNAYDIIDRFKFSEQIQKLDESNLLFLILSRFTEIDLHPNTVSNIEMGYIFEELIRKFAELSNETAGEHFTPREVIRLMVNILFVSDDEILSKKGIIRTLYDPACGTGGMLSVAQEYLQELNPNATLEVFGQELNDESYAICNADMMIKGLSTSNIAYGNSFSSDGFAKGKYDYMLCNPPFGVEWKKVEKNVKDEHSNLGFAGRFGAGLPRISDGQLLFLQHMISKMQPENGGCRLAIVFNGSPLFTGNAGSGESEIRRWIIENDWLEGIIAMPDQLFYNTGINTYIWVLTNRKTPERKGKVQLLNGVEYFQKMRKSLGDKRKEISPEQIRELTNAYAQFVESDICKVFDKEDFGYQQITIERPLRLNFAITDERIQLVKDQSAFQNLAKTKKKRETGQQEIKAGEKLQQEIISLLESLKSDKIYKNRDAFTKELKKALKSADISLGAPVMKAILTGLSERDETADICRDNKGNPEPDAELRDIENVPLKESIYTYFEREVKPHVPDAWIDESKTKIGYEIPFTRHFYQYQLLRPSEVILKEIVELEQSIQEKLKQVLGNG